MSMIFTNPMTYAIILVIICAILLYKFHKDDPLWLIPFTCMLFFGVLWFLINNSTIHSNAKNNYNPKFRIGQRVTLIDSDHVGVVISLEKDSSYPKNDWFPKYDGNTLVVTVTYEIEYTDKKGIIHKYTTDEENLIIYKGDTP